MPIYEYDCPQCGPFEISQRISEHPLTHHECGAPVSRRISLTSFALKGGGWYADGYGSSQKAKAGSSDAASCAASSGGCDKVACPAKAAEA